MATPAPKLGQHNRELLREVGVDDARYRELMAQGAVYEGTEAQGEELE